MSSEKRYDHQEVEQKWQQYWKENETFRAETTSEKPKYYVLDMFPYPSGAGLHVGHPEGYTATDIIARYKRMNGFNVLHPMGWDAFGLPAENYAIKTGQHPEKTTTENIATFKRQIESLGFSYDWSREFSTTDPEYYRWTQWIFLQMYKKGLLYEQEMPMNWCPKCRIVAANEEVEGGCHERCGTEVERRNLKQWMFRITEYAERLLHDLEKPNVILIHGWEGTGTKGWFSEIIQLCTENGIEVLSPDFPNTKTPKYTEWKTYFEEIVRPSVTNKSIILGHSLGSGFLQRYCTEENIKVAGIIMVAPTANDCGISEIKNFFENPFDYEAIKNSADNIFLYAGGKDKFIPQKDFQFLAKNLNAHFHFFPEEDHFGQSEHTSNPLVQKHFKKIVSSLLNWPEKIIAMQKNWIGKSEGIEIEYPVEGLEETITCYTTRPDTNFGATFVVLAPEHEFLKKHLDLLPKKTEVEKYRQESAKKSDIDRMTEGRKKTGTFTGLYVTNRLNNKKLPLYVGDFVLAHVGTGAVVGVPGHDMRDFEFSQEMGIDVIRVVISPDGDTSPITKPEQVQEVAGTMINSEFLDGLSILEAKEKIMEYLVEKKQGTRKINYKLRDWIFTRQRYWGEPIPLVRDEKGNIFPLDESELPVTLPETDTFLPTEDGKSPLAKVQNWVEQKGKILENGSVKLSEKGTQTFFRETSTMPNWAGSNWYWLRFMDAQNTSKPWSKEAEQYWGPVDLYVGGAEHAVLHLLYSRFWHKVFYDMGLVSTKEPFQKLMNQGLILAEDGQKMSKSLGNVVNPDEIVEQYGADTLRMYEMFMGPFEQNKAWNTDAVEGMYKFLQRIWRTFQEKEILDMCPGHDFQKLVHKTIQKVTHDIEEFKFNTAISGLMILVNAMQKVPHLPKNGATKFVQMLSPFAPHLAEELWKECLNHTESIAYSSWPTWDEKFTKDEEGEIAVQVCGKLRGSLTVSVNIEKEEIVAQAKALENVQRFLEGKQILKEIYVPGKIVNIVVR